MDDIIICLIKVVGEQTSIHLRIFNELLIQYENVIKENERLKEQFFQVQRLQLKDNDTIVLKSVKSLSDNAIHNVINGVKKGLEGKGISNINVLLLAPGMDVEVIGKSDKEE